MANEQSTKTPAPPSFQFYPSDFMAGTTLMSLAEVGGYLRLLCFQWHHGHVPGDTMRDVARIMGCTIGQAKTIWRVVSEKFICHERDVWKNARMERERQKQVERRSALADSGRKGMQRRYNEVITTLVPPATTPLYQPPNLSSSSSSSFSSSDKNNCSSSGPRAFDRLHANHILGFCAFKCLSDEKVAEFARDLPGGLTDANFAVALTWAESLRDTWGDRPKAEFKWFEFWEARWKERTATDSLEAGRPKGRAS